MVHEVRNVLLVLAQGRQRDLHHLQPVVEILAETPGVDLGQEVAIGGGNDAHIHRQQLRAAHRSDLEVFKRAQ